MRQPPLAQVLSVCSRCTQAPGFYVHTIYRYSERNVFHVCFIFYDCKPFLPTTVETAVNDLSCTVVRCFTLILIIIWINTILLLIAHGFNNANIMIMNIWINDWQNKILNRQHGKRSDINVDC